ncbi:MAG: hypothetical protein OJF55_000923 [Rhodanobacteraceae bacterium]|jgi:hypothetical protein|nr:MAG: hypothetical protein OJF55_000923 [Rhodanobacteraceae bacterium]
MNWSDDIDAAATHDTAPESANGSGLFPGDTGSLPLDARRVLCQLLAGPSLDAERHGLLWPVLLREETAIRARLAELFLELVLDRDLRVAFVRQADTGEMETPILLRSSPLTFIDSVLLLNLRQRLAEASAQGQRAVVDADELHAQLAVYEPPQGTDRAGFTKKLNAAIEKMKKNNVLQSIRGSEGRYEVAPTLKLLFSAEEVQALGAVYRELASSGRPFRDDEGGEDE